MLCIASIATSCMWNNAFHRTIPSLPALASTFGAACWLLWGYLDNDIFVCVPSVIALLLGSVQLSLIGFYGSGAPKHP